MLVARWAPAVRVWIANRRSAMPTTRSATHGARHRVSSLKDPRAEVRKPGAWRGGLEEHAVAARRSRHLSVVGGSTTIRREEPLEAVEDQIQSELELAVVAVARLKDVLGRQLREVGVVL